MGIFQDRTLRHVDPRGTKLRKYRAKVPNRPRVEIESLTLSRYYVTSMAVSE